jgi:pyrroloquinoline quinone biosynthesis protein B
VSADGRRWLLLNVSPDVTRQIENTPALQPLAPPPGAPSRRLRSSPIIGALLTNGDIDHSMGLLSLREWTPFALYATAETYSGLVDHNAVFRTLERQRPHVLQRALELDATQSLRDVEGNPSGLSVCAFPVAGKVPLHLETFMPGSTETNVGLIIADEQTGARLLYVPGAASVEGMAERARGADCLFFDGTFWSDSELSAFGQSKRLAREMAHLPVSGPDGSLELLASLPVARRFYTHINNTNPMLRNGSDERLAVEERGWRVAEDGLELSI